MNLNIRATVISVVIVGAVSGAGAVLALSASGDNQGPAAMASALSSASSPETNGEVRSLGGDPNAAKPALRTSKGLALSVLAVKGQRCIVYSDSTDMCRSEDQIRAGKGLKIENDCLSTSDHAMVISGLLPGGTEKATLKLSDGTTESLPSAEGAFAWDGTTPTEEGDPHPTAISYDGTAGTITLAFPLKVGDFCPTGQ